MVNIILCRQVQMPGVMYNISRMFLLPNLFTQMNCFRMLFAAYTQKHSLVSDNLHTFPKYIAFKVGICEYIKVAKRNNCEGHNPRHAINGYTCMTFLLFGHLCKAFYSKLTTSCCFILSNTRIMVSFLYMYVCKYTYVEKVILLWHRSHVKYSFLRLLHFVLYRFIT